MKKSRITPVQFAAARFVRPHRFPEIACSQCGNTFGSGNFGYSDCKRHRADQKRGVAA